MLSARTTSKALRVCSLLCNGHGHTNGYAVEIQERPGSSFSQLRLEPNHTGLTAQSLFFLEELWRVKRSDIQTFLNFSNYFK